LLEALIAVPFLAVTLFLATIQTHLEIEEDPRAGSLSIARALLLVMLGSLWLLMPQLGIWQAVLPALLFAVWFAQQLGGRLLGRMRLAAGLATKAEVVVASIARVFHPLRLKAPEQLEEYEQDLIESVEDFSETLVREVMVPRVDLEVVEHDSKLESALSTFIASGYSRLPVVGEDVDDIRGILYLKDVAKLFHQNPALLSEKSAEEVSRKALFVPDTKVVSELMRQMQESRVHVAVVSDEYGGIAGLVTIEDLIEELVGDISDEYDRELGGIEDLGEGSFRVSPRVTLDELSEHCDMELEDEDVDTVGGLLTKAVGALPSGGEVVSALGLELTAERVDARRGRILSIRVRTL
jgi:Mg2+/Co2+ transporter CorC